MVALAFYNVPCPHPLMKRPLKTKNRGCRWSERLSNRHSLLVVLNYLLISSSLHVPLGSCSSLDTHAHVRPSLIHIYSLTSSALFPLSHIHLSHKPAWSIQPPLVKTHSEITHDIRTAMERVHVTRAATPIPI